MTVVGGAISKEELVLQLQRIVPIKWRWDPVAHDDKSFVVQFPSKAELQRAIAYGGADVMENGVATGGSVKVPGMAGQGGRIPTP